MLLEICETQVFHTEHVKRHPCKTWRLHLKRHEGKRYATASLNHLNGLIKPVASHKVTVAKEVLQTHAWLIDITRR